MSIDQSTPAFLNGGGEMGELMRSKDWSTTSLGAPHGWPSGLRTIINIMLHSEFPMFVWWGKELFTFYNDPYRLIAGEKHPDLLGKSGNEAWSEIWEELSPLVEKTFQGTATWADDQLLMVNRHGFLEETYFTFSYSPVFSDAGNVEGLFCACIETTEKVMATRKILESERNFRNTILQSPVAMCILKGATHVVEIANSRMFELWGRNEEELINKPIFDGLPEAREQGLEELLNSVYVSGNIYSEDERGVMLPRNGKVEQVYMNLVYQPFREGNGTISGVLVVALDVTSQVISRKKIEESELELQMRVIERTEELVKQNNLVDNLLRNSSNGISVSEMIRNESGEIVDARTILANDAAVSHIGIPKDLYFAKTATDFDPDIFKSPYGLSCLSTLQTGEPFVIQYYLELSARWLELTVSKMDENHLIHIFSDVTSVKESQLQLEKTVEELRLSNANLEQFSYAASHDLKEPVRKINVFSERLKKELSDSLSENHLHLFDRMGYATKRMIVLIDDLLDYSHTTKGILDIENINLNKKVEVVLEDLDLQVQEKKARVSVEQLPTIRGNRRQIQQLFQNLISNALKYSNTDTPPEIQITSKTGKGKDFNAKLVKEEDQKLYHLIEVRDNGIGFEQQYAEDIFNVFTRLHRRNEYAGSGVGLSLVKKVVDNHNGFIWAESKPGEGSVFKILLPVNQFEESPIG